MSDTERTALQRLSAFSGGCSLEAAEAVCSAEDVGSPNVLDLLSRLVDKSLLVAEVTQGQSRYHLLETIRDYARRKLAESGETAAARDRHLQYFVAWAEKAAPHLPRTADEPWLERFDVEHDNVRAALDWSLASADGAQAGLRLAAAAGIYWRLRGYPQEGRARLTAALSARGCTAPDRGARPGAGPPGNLQVLRKRLRVRPRSGQRKPCDLAESGEPRALGTGLGVRIAGRGECGNRQL